VFEGKRAIGLETTQPDGKSPIEADQIVMCAGAIKYPCLLM
jgi:choline dehydrogenase